MKFGDYVDNPSGGTKSASTGLGFIRDGLKARYLLLSHKITVDIYNYKDGYLFIMGIPSEQKSFELKYDVAIYVFPSNESSNRSINSWQYQVFCNSPSFTFTFAYVYNKHGLLIEEFVRLYENIVLTQEPKERNPKMEINYEKTLFYAIYHISKSHMYSQVSFLKGAAKMYNPLLVGGSLRDNRTILKDIEKEKKRIKKESSKSTISKPKDIIKNIMKKITPKSINKIEPKSKIDGSKRKTVNKIKKR